MLAQYVSLIVDHTVKNICKILMTVATNESGPKPAMKKQELK
jgi:hypothetical protein